MMSFRQLSINLKLPLLVAGLLLAVVTIFASLAYREVAGRATTDATARLNQVATQLADMISQQGRALKTGLAAVARDSAVLALRSDRSAPAVERAVKVLGRLQRDTSQHLTAEVRDRDGAILAAFAPRGPGLTLAGDSAPSRPDSAAISPLYLYADSMFYEVTIPFPDHGGWVVERRLVTASPQAMARFSQLIGTDARLYFGNREGQLWTDFIKRVDPPRSGDTSAVYQRGGARQVGAFVAAADTPWILAAESPMSAVLSSTRALLRRFIILAMLIIGVGGIVGWLLSRQISRPLADLTHAAEDVASGQVQHLPQGRRQDEIGRLSEAFRIMLERVSGGQIQMEALVEDLRRAQETVRGTLETLRAVFQASPLPIVAMSRDEKVQFWNLAAERTFGWPAEEVIGKPLPFIPDNLQQESDRLWEDALNGQVFTGLEVRRKRRDGVMMDMRLTVSAIFGEDQKATGVVAVYEDITERRRLEDHLRHIQRLDAVGKLAGGIAHDFNNLLTVILTEAELGLAESSPGGREALTAVRQTAERAATLTRQLLAFARRQPLKEEVFQLGTMVSEVEKMLQRLIGDNVTLTTAIAEGLWPVKADRGQIEQVITNLVVNARDAMPNGGRVTIAAENLTLSPADVDSKPELEAGEWTVLSIEDTGSGIADDVRARLFEPFFTTKEAGKGTGLGLATCHGIVQQSGGRILVHSEVGKGSRFTVQLPRATHLDRTSDRKVETPDEDDAGGLILLVEDYSELRSVAARVLNRAGYQVITAESGEEALRLVEAGLRPDLLVSDIGLPGVNGVRLAETIQQAQPLVRVLLCSGSKDYEHLLRSNDSGGFLEKPYRVEELIRAVRTVLKKPFAKAS